MMDRSRAWEILARILFRGADSRVSALLESERKNALLQANLVSLANASYCSASLWSALKGSGLADHLSEDVANYLEGFYELNMHRNASIRAQLIECIDALNRIEISPMPLKGAALILTGIYRNPAERFLADIDILVPEARMADANRALANIGYAPGPNRFDFSGHHHAPTLVRTLKDAAVELHRAPVHAIAGNALKTREIWERATTVRDGDRQWCNASCTDMAMLTFLHGEIVDENLSKCVVDLRGFSDLRRIIQYSRSDIDWRLNRARLDTARAQSIFRRYQFVYYRLTGQAVLPEYRHRWRDRVHFALCKQAIRRPTISRIARELTAQSVRRRYDPGSKIAMNAYRAVALGRIVRNRIMKYVQ